MKSLFASAALLTVATGISQALALENPAAVYRVSVGGCIEIRKNPQGGAGYCHLPDGRIVEE